MDRRSALNRPRSASRLGLSGVGLWDERPVRHVRPFVWRGHRQRLLGSIIRTTVGLRRTGPRASTSVRKLDDNTVVHNYGHGAGHSLGWGVVACRGARARAPPPPSCGDWLRPVGLTAARQLQRRGFDVTIYTKAVQRIRRRTWRWRHSRRPGLISTSHSRIYYAVPARGRSVVSPAATARGRDYCFPGSTASHTTDTQLLVAAIAPNAGGAGTNFLGSDMDWFRSESMKRRRIVLGPGGTRFHRMYASGGARSDRPSIYLDALVRDFLMFNGRIVIRVFDTPRASHGARPNLIVNCSGLGARTLFSDETMFPVKVSNGAHPSAESTPIRPCRGATGSPLARPRTRRGHEEPNPEAQQRIVDASSSS